MSKRFLFVVLVLLSILSAVPASAATDPSDNSMPDQEPIANLAHSIFVTSMTELADAYQYATQVATARGEVIACPVPGSTFVASFGAPRDGHTHQCTDMMASDGTPIYAPEPGLYHQHGNDSFYLDGASGAQWFGTHLQGHARGDGPVQAGELIAYVGHSGNATASAPHLHIEYHPGGEGSAAVEHYPALATACLGATPVTGVVESRVASVPVPTFVYGRMAVHRYWNAEIERITPNQARILTRYLNTVVGNRVAAYVGALHRDCSGPSDCPALIRAAFARYGLAWRGDEAVNVASCESGFNPNAQGGGGGNYGGLFQQSMSYWPSRAAAMGFPGASVFDPWANASVSAQMVRADGDWGQWSCGP